jgi:hypothetical protein
MKTILGILKRRKANPFMIKKKFPRNPFLQKGFQPRI